MSLALAGSLFLSSCTSCGTHESPEHIRRATANATRRLKQDTVAVAQGVREGLARQKTVDINTASRKELQAGLGLSAAQAERVIKHRPYEKADQLVSRRAMTVSEYDRVRDRVAVKK